MQLGLVTYMWGAKWDLPTVIRNCEQTGFGGVELRSTHAHGVEPTLSKQQRREVANRFGDTKVELVGLGSACEYHSADSKVLKENIELSKQFIELAHDVGAAGVKVRPNGLPKEVPVDKTIEQISRSLTEVGEAAEGYGVEIRVELHGRGTAEIPVFQKIMAGCQHPSVKVTWNCNPTDLKGDGLAANFAHFKDRLGPVHIHDLISSYPWVEFFGLLKGANFEGWTLVEEGAPTTDPIRVMKYYRLLWERMTA